MKTKWASKASNITPFEYKMNKVLVNIIFSLIDPGENVGNFDDEMLVKIILKEVNLVLVPVLQPYKYSKLQKSILF